MARARNLRASNLTSGFDSANEFLANPGSSSLQKLKSVANLLQTVAK